MTSHMVSLWSRIATNLIQLKCQINCQKTVSNKDSKDIYKSVHFVILCLLLLSEQTTIKHLMSQVHYATEFLVKLSDSGTTVQL